MDPNVRRLAAVWFADIVGYTRLSSSDEPAALRLVGIFQHAARTATAAHGGRLVHFMGDAALAEFNSTDAAMKAAVRLQRDFATASAEAGCDASLRIGIHVGDVVQSPDGDVFGDGVNTASRLQEIARPGQIVCSQDVWRHLRPRGEFGFDSLGERQLQGIPGKVWLFSVREAAADGTLGSQALPVRRALAARTIRIVRIVLVYLVAALVVFQLTQVLRDNFGLPAWVTPLAFALLAVGLLVMLLTGWVQSRPTWDRPVGQKPEWTLDLREAIDELRHSRLPELTWPRALAAGVFAFAILFGLAGTINYLRNSGRTFTRTAAADPGVTLAILPFQAIGEDAELFREGMPDLLGINLAHGAGVRVVHPLHVQNRWNVRGGSDSPRAVIDVGQDVSARFVLAGDVRATGDRLHFTARLYDVLGDTLLSTVEVDGSPDSVSALADSLGARVLRGGLYTGEGDAPRLNLGRLATTSMPALRSFLEGEQQFRRTRMAEAKAAFRDAVDRDPGFAFALYRYSLTNAWLSYPHEPRLDEQAEIAARNLVGLPERQALLIRAHVQLARSDPQAIGTLRELIDRHPDDVEGWFLLGDAYYHVGQRIGAPPDSFRLALEKGIEIDPGFGPPYLHLIEDAAARFDTVRAHALLDAFKRVDPRSPLLSGFDLGTALGRREPEPASPPAAEPTTPAREPAPPPRPDRSGYDAALRSTDAARREALAAGASGARMSMADSLRARGVSLARAGRFADAEPLVDRARLMYEDARAHAVWGARLDSVRAVIAPLGRTAAGATAREGADLVSRAESAESAGRYADALRYLEQALRTYRTAPAPQVAAPEPQPVQPAAPAQPSEDEVRTGIEQALARIAQAIESEDMNALVAAWPTLDATQRNSLSALFAGTRDIDVRFDVRDLAIGEEQVTATVHTTYRYYNEVDRSNDTTSAPQVFVFTLRDGRWVVTSSR